LYCVLRDKKDHTAGVFKKGKKVFGSKSEEEKKIGIYRRTLEYDFNDNIKKKVSGGR